MSDSLTCRPSMRSETSSATTPTPDDYQLWEIVSGVEQRFSVPTAEAVQLSYRAIESLLTDGLGELSFGHWDSEPRRVDATDLPPPEDEAQWGYPPPDERFLFFAGLPD